MPNKYRNWPSLIEVDIPKYARETIFYCWTKQKYETLESPVSDFEIDVKTFEVGAREKGKKQIEDVKEGYVVKLHFVTLFSEKNR